MSKRHRKNKQNVELQYSSAEIFIPSIILLIFIVICGIMIVNYISNLRIEDEIDEDTLIWEKAFVEAEKQKVGIIFDSISTTEEEYGQLREKCTEFIENNKEAKEVDANIAVDTIVDEKVFIDGEEQLSLSNKTTDESAETGPIYFQDMLMNRYINSSGELRVVAAIFNNDKSDIIITRKDKLVDTLESLDKESSALSGESAVSEDIEKDWVSESEYIRGVDRAIKSMLLARTKEDIEQAETLALKYFTLDGKQMVFGNRDSLNISSDSRLKTEFIQAGKSNSSKTYKDRIYMQLKLNVEDKEADIYLILKLNSNLRIFDIDIL